MFDYFKKIAITKRAEDEVLYEYVLNEIENGYMVKGLWAKALANSQGNEANARSIYMQYRVQSIKDIFTAHKIAYNELTKSKLFQYITEKILPTTNDLISVQNEYLISEKSNNNDYYVNKYEEKIYERVAEELQNGIRKEGLWLKAIENTNGDENKALALYIKYRSESIKNEKEAEERKKIEERKRKLEIERLEEERKRQLEIEKLKQEKQKLKIFLEKNKLNKIKEISNTKILANYYNSPIDVYVELVNDEWKIVEL